MKQSMDDVLKKVGVSREASNYQETQSTNESNKRTNAKNVYHHSKIRHSRKYISSFRDIKMSHTTKCNTEAIVLEFYQNYQMNRIPKTN